MNIFLWIILGAIAGWIAGKIMRRGKGGLITNILVGIIGANIGGFIATKFLGMGGVTGFNLYSILISVAGSCVLLLILGILMGKR